MRTLCSIDVGYVCGVGGFLRYRGFTHTPMWCLAAHVPLLPTFRVLFLAVPLSGPFRSLCSPTVKTQKTDERCVNLPFPQGWSGHPKLLLCCISLLNGDDNVSCLLFHMYFSKQPHKQMFNLFSLRTIRWNVNETVVFHGHWKLGGYPAQFWCYTDKHVSWKELANCQFQQPKTPEWTGSLKFINWTLWCLLHVFHGFIRLLFFSCGNIQGLNGWFLKASLV